MTSDPTRPVPDPQVREGEVTSVTFGYLGAIFLGPVIPLIVYLIKARKSPFLRYHAAAAVNLSLSCLLYAVCCVILGGLLALDSITAALVIALSLAFGIWVTMLTYLVRGVIAANRGEPYDIPQWICARIVHLGLGQRTGHRVRQQAAAAGQHDPAAGVGGRAGQAFCDHRAGVLAPGGIEPGHRPSLRQADPQHDPL